LGALFAFWRAIRAPDRVFLRHTQGNRFCFAAKPSGSLLTSGKRANFRAQREWRVAPPTRVDKKDAKQKTRDFLGFSSFFAVFRHFARKVRLFLKFGF